MEEWYAPKGASMKDFCIENRAAVVTEEGEDLLMSLVPFDETVEVLVAIGVDKHLKKLRRNMHRSLSSDYEVKLQASLRSLALLVTIRD